MGYLAALQGALSIDGAASALGTAGAWWRGEGLAAGLKFGLIRSLLEVMPMVGAITSSDILEPTPRSKRIAGVHPEQFDRLADLDQSDAYLPNVRRESWLGQKVAAIRADHDAERARLESELEGFGYNPAIRDGRYRGGAAPNWTVDDIRNAVGMGGSNGQPVEAKVVGEATLKTVVEVLPSPSFMASIRQEMSNTINAFKGSGVTPMGSTGSTGRSMPEAAASGP
jgi:hypothetical protein